MKKHHLILRRKLLDCCYFSSCRFSIESGHNNRSSRRHSLDSQMSFHVSDAERLAALHTAARFGRRKRRDWFSLRRGRRVNAWDRRGSNTSDDSNLGSMVSTSGLTDLLCMLCKETELVTFSPLQDSLLFNYSFLGTLLHQPRKDQVTFLFSLTFVCILACNFHKYLDTGKR